MPHVIVKLWPGKSEQQKVRLAEAIVKDVMDVLGYGQESVSVAMEEVEAQDWADKVYKPDDHAEGAVQQIYRSRPENKAADLAARPIPIYPLKGREE